jgi:hypothetical protein
MTTPRDDPLIERIATGIAVISGGIATYMIFQHTHGGQFLLLMLSGFFLYLWIGIFCAMFWGMMGVLLVLSTVLTWVARWTGWEWARRIA